MYEVKSNGVTIEFGVPYESAMKAFTASAARDCKIYRHMPNGSKHAILWR